MPLCDYGCGQEATHYSTKVKKHCCVKHPRGCPAYKLVMAERTRKQMDTQSGLTSEQRAQGDKERRAQRQKNRVAKGKAEKPPEGQLCEYGCGQPARHHLRPLVKDDQGTRFTWKWCCSPHYRQCPTAKEQSWEKQQATSLERTGYVIHQQSPRFLETYKATCQERYGVDFAPQAEEVKAKREATNLERYGNRGAMSKETIGKRLATVRHRYGVDNVFQDPTIKQRARDSVFRRLGVYQHCQHGPTFRRIKRGMFGFKPFTLPSGRVVQLQGYEPDALQDLLQTYQETAFDFDTLPSFPYVDGYQRDRVYHPDLYIPNAKLIIEVKSWWTLKENYEINRLKQQAVLDAGFRFQLWVKGPRDRRFDIIEDPLPDFPIP